MSHIDPSPQDAVRAFPHAIGSEKSVLSVMMQEPETNIPRSRDDNLTAEHFHIPAHALLFDFLREMFDSGHAIELITFRQRLSDRGMLERIGGQAALVDVWNYALGSAFWSDHVDQLRDKAILRAVINLGTVAIEAAYNSPDEARDVLSEAERGITAISAMATGSSHVMTMREVMRESFERFQRRAEGVEHTMGIGTIPAIDEKLKGCHPGRMWVICAYPEGGKSVMASQMILDMVLEGHPAMFLSLEMPERDVMDRMMIQGARIEAAAFTEPLDYSRANGGESINAGLMKAINSLVPRLANAPLRIHRPANRQLATIISAIRRAHREMGIKAAVVDYIQLVRSGKHATAEAEVSEISHALQALAGDLGITLIVLSQLNAEGDTKHGRVIEEDADAVLSIAQDRNKESETYKQHRFVMVSKDRHYGSGGERISLVLDRARIRFVHGLDETVKPKIQFKR